ncbi:hypothetical protein PNEG_02866 [Pneumocystis murina B123]|uniref:Uncharacterized protein n=1 Tax=Pneumocystis murina (strain B123) TaxID=1069680 RepID=M7NJ92_PNEMU|nr:hypothetical protein PNEG_02866 [Pneumocystis murina B123]EMR08688.1 hypothetical protein PNEG_02866 [Pneumocystis murina B123]
MYFNGALIMGLLSLSIVPIQCIGSAIYSYDSAQVLNHKEFNRQPFVNHIQQINERWIPWFGRPIDK